MRAYILEDLEVGLFSPFGNLVLQITHIRFVCGSTVVLHGLEFPRLVSLVLTL